MEEREYVDDMIGKFIHYSTITLSIILVFYSLGSILSSGIYGYIYPPGSYRAIIHSTSLLSMSLAFLVYYLMLGHLYPLTRAIVCLAMTVWSIHTYDLTWSVFSQVIRGSGFSWIAVMAVIIVTYLLVRFDNKHLIFRLSPTWTGRRLTMIILYAIFILSFKGLIDTGFFQAMALYDVGAGPDPNVGNIYWLIGKIIVFWLFLPLIDKRDYKVPLLLDPRVLVW